MRIMKNTAITRICLGIIILLSIIGGVLVTYSTANGPWGYTDPVVYISTANSMLHGQGLGYYEGNAQFVHMTWYPPFYSLLLSVIGLTGINLVSAARWLNILLFMASIFIAGWIFLRFSQVPILGVFASALLLSFPHMLEMFSSTYSEPLFIFLSLLSGLCILFTLKNNNPIILIISALVTGLIPFTRYAGVAMLASGSICIYILTSGGNWSRIKKTTLFASISALPTILWFLWVYIVGNKSVGGRDVALTWETIGAKFQSFRATFMDTVWEWIPFQRSTTALPYNIRFIMLGIVLIAIIFLSYFARRYLSDHAREIDQKPDSLVLVYFGSSSLVYLAVLIVSYLFILPTIAIDDRMLLPLFVGILMGVLGAIALWQKAWFSESRHLIQILPWLVGIICVYWYVPQVQSMAKLYHQGVGLTDYHWNRSKLIQAVRALPTSTPVIANDWELVMLWTQRPVYGLWTTFPTGQPSQTSSYGANPGDQIQSVFCNQGAALVIFNDFPGQLKDNIGGNVQNLASGLFSGLTSGGDYPDGKIYYCH
jgi:hypothetical protein